MTWSKSPSKHPQIGQLVLIYEDELPRSMWKLARIIELPSERTAVLITVPNNNVTRRATCHLYPLEIEQPESVESIESNSLKPDQQSKSLERPNEPVAIQASPRTRRKLKKKVDPNFVYEDEM